MTIEQNTPQPAKTVQGELKRFGKKDIRNFASRHTDGKAFEWIASKDDSQPQKPEQEACAS